MTDFNTKAFEDRLHRIGKEVQSFFENLVSEDELDVFSPKADFVQTSEGFEILMDLPGLTKSDIKVELTDAMLTIKGERTINETDLQVAWLRRERHYGSFSRSFPVPVPVSKSDVSAQFKDGVLKILIKAEDMGPQDTTIDID
ncbi:MAG: Hsp20/alpha crystallin family protein [Bacteroidetes bacterium]|nr:Hsp20/alpha crystallin family protein [Bacteroidota bacterium]